MEPSGGEEPDGPRGSDRVGEGEPIADAKSLLVSVNQTFAACVDSLGEAAGKGNESTGATLVEPPGRGACGERRAHGEHNERQSCDHRFHFHLHSLISAFHMETGAFERSAN